MKKETRFNKKITDFFWAILSWLPTIILLFTFVLICFNFNQVGVVDGRNYLSVIFDIFFDGDFGVQFELIWDNIPGFLPRFLQPVFMSLINFEFFEVDFGYMNHFILWQFLHLIFICIIRLLANILMFLPKLGNYFISKWSGD